MSRINELNYFVYFNDSSKEMEILLGYHTLYLRNVEEFLLIQLIVEILA